MELFEGQFIAGKHSADGTTRFSAADAASGETLPTDFVEATAKEIAAACTAAAEATDGYGSTGLEDRAVFLETVAEELDSKADAFVERTCRETGLPEARIRGELGRTTGQLRLFATVVRAGDFLGVRVDHSDPDRQPAPKPELRSYQVPVGPVAVFGASNFPLAFSVVGGDTASALAAGCPVVVKAHPGHPGTSALAAAAVDAAVQRCGMPAGVFSMVQGASHEVGGALVADPHIKSVGFTGSHRGGMALVKLAAQRDEPIPVHAEMGSVNPLFLLPGALDAKAEEIAGKFVGSLTLGCGQFCTNPGVTFAASGDGLERFLEGAKSELQQAAPGVMLHAGILSAYEAGVAKLGGAKDVQEVARGQQADGRAQPRLFRTTLAEFQANPELAEEVFGPCGLVVEVPDAAQFAPAAAGLQGQLTAGLHAADGEVARFGPLVKTLEKKAGRLLVNGFPTGVEVAHAMVHGGPYPATTDSRTTSVGTLAIERFLRPVCYQDFPDDALPPALQSGNPLKLRRLVDGERTG